MGLDTSERYRAFVEWAHTVQNSCDVSRIVRDQLLNADAPSMSDSDYHRFDTRQLSAIYSARQKLAFLDRHISKELMHDLNERFNKTVLVFDSTKTEMNPIKAHDFSPYWLQFEEYYQLWAQLNASTLWEKMVIETRSYDKLQRAIEGRNYSLHSVGRMIETGGAKLYFRLLINVCISTVYGNEAFFYSPAENLFVFKNIDDAQATRDPFNKISDIISEKFPERVADMDELRERLKIILGTSHDPGLLVKSLQKVNAYKSRSNLNRNCPVPSVSNAIFGAFGDFVADENDWAIVAGRMSK